MPDSETASARGVLCGRRTVAATVVAVAMLAMAGAAGAARQARLGEPVTLSGPTGLQQPMMAAASANGVQAFTWVRFRRPVTIPQGGFGGPAGVVQARLRGPSGGLTRVQTLSPGDRRAFAPAIGVDRAGIATAVWLQQVRRGTFDVVVSVRRPGRRFERAVPLGTTRVPRVRVLYPGGRYGSGYGAEPALAVAADGSAVVAWRGARALHIASRRAGRCPAGARRACFSRPQELPLGAEPQVAFDARNRAYVVWAGLRAPATGIQLAAARPGRPFSPTTVSPPGDAAFDPSVAVTPDRGAIVVWVTRSPGPGVGGSVRTVVRSPNGTLSTPLTLSDPARLPPGITSPFGAGVSRPSIVATPRGEAVVVWQQATVPEVSGGLLSAVWSSGAFGASQVVDPGAAFEPRLAADGSGSAVLAYSHGFAGFGDWRVRPPGAAFGPDGGLAGSPVFAVTRNANAVTIGVLGRSTRLLDVPTG